MASYWLKYWLNINTVEKKKIKSTSDLKFWWQLHIFFRTIVLFRLELYASREKKIEFQNFGSSDIKTFKRETGVNVSTFLHEMA